MDLKELAVNEQKHTQKNHPWEYARARVINNLLKHIIKNDDSAHFAVDVGCGDIFFLNRYCGWHENTLPIAVDTAFSDEIMDNLTKRYSGIHLKCFKDIKKVDLNGEKASIVFLMDVIEHIENDTDFLIQLSQCDFIDENTTFMITVPAFNRLFCSHDKWLGHYRRYSQKDLQLCIKKAGLQNITGGYFFTSLLLPRLIQKLMEKTSKKQNDANGIGGWTGNKIISWFYKSFLLADYYFFHFFRLLGIKVPGLSTYSICKLQ